MKKPTILKIALFLLLLLQADIVSSQNLKPFVRQFDKQLKGDILVIGNNILNRRETRNGVTTGPNTAYNGTGLNGNFDMRYINIDNGATTGIFSSSSANLTVPNNRAPADPCYRVAYAALYWSATLNGTNRANINKVKIKVPNTANNAYQDITGTIIHDITTSAGGINPDNTQAYACFAEITNLLSPSNPNGTYTVANVISSEGSNGGTGLSAGWSLFIVYEDSSLPTKAISTFNGFTARAQGGGPNNTVINGFTTIPTGPVQARFAFAALEGDYGYTGDYLQINGSKITPPTRPRQGNSDNFFNSSINSLGASFTDRVPNSTNTLGFDTGVIDIDPSANIIKNNDTSATITLATNSDIFIYYFTAFSVDIIAPKIVLTKGVKDINNNDASNKDVTLGEELRYELGFKNEGNDNATSFTIVDQLPVNTNFNFPADIISMPTGMTIPTTSAGNQYVTYNATTRTLTFTIPNSYVTFLPKRTSETIKFRVKVVDDCSKLTDACSNIIKNSAESHYFGDKGGTGTDFGDKSYSTVAGCNIIPQSTNFLVGLDACKNRRQEICTSSMTISASGGYKSYSWSRNSSGTPVIGTNQTLSITQPGTYYVYNTANPPCVDLQETITVVDAGGVRVNPVILYADNKEADGTIIGCEIDGKPLPKIYLCGTNDSRLINTNISGATIVWEKTTCVRPVDLSERCADERTSCAWVSAGPNGPIFTANAAGYYRVTINSGGCINTHYFNVYKSDVSATISKKDKLCYKAGNITVQQLTGYEYSLTNVSANTTGGWQDSNSFDIWNAGTYYVNYRLKNVATTCVYKTQQVIINDLNINATIENPNEQPLCFGSSGTITASASAGFSAYYFVLYDGATIINQVGPLTDRVYTFTAAPGKYYEVEIYSVDADGKKDCTARAGKYINNPSSEIKPVSTTITPLTACSEGKYRISATGGTGPYSYFVDGSTEAQAYSENDNTEQNNIIIVAPAAKTYTIRVVDSKLCESTITFTVPNLPKPTYIVSHTDSACYNSGAQITVTLGAGGANGYTMGYSINNGGTYQASPIFSNLQPGTYKVRVKYSITYPVPYWPNTETKECIDPAQDVIISGPTAALVASGGVAELAGCTLAQLGGKLRINNAQGGTAPYQYSFDGGSTWQASNEKDVLPGQYILKIRDSKGCEYTIPYNIVLDPKPAEPTIKVEDPVFNCNGTATSKVTVTNGTSANYTYEYYLDNKPNTPITNNVFENVPSGSHTVSVKYNVSTVSTYSNLLQEDFGKGGYTTTPGISPVYCFEDESTPHPASWSTLCGSIGDYQINDGKYAVASSIKTNFGNTWIVAKDHTTPADPLGRFLCVNIGSSAGVGGIIYSKPIKDVIVNQPVIISLWAENLMRSTTGSNYSDPQLTIQLVNNLNGVGGTETIVATTDTANPWIVPRNEKWEYKELSLNPGAYNNLSFVIRSYNTNFSGNDLLVDDIWVRQIPKSCIATKDFPIVIDTNKAFSASIVGHKDVTCNGANNGEITLAAQNFALPYGFDYSMDNGANWTNSKTSPVTVGGLTSQTYKILIRYDNKATSCSFPFDQPIGSPALLTITADVTKTATCTTGATITALAGGGTPAYQYELRGANGITVVRAFQTSGVFDNVPTGTYTVVTRDANTCSSTASAQVTVNAPTLPKASLAPSTNYCVNSNSGATLIVTATGTGSITYSLDGAPAQTSNTFTNVGPGTHSITVTDSNNCPVSINGIVIAPELTAKSSITKTLDCTTPSATIKVDITDGVAPYTYKVKKDAGTFSAIVNVTGATFNYPATASGLYTFEITDAKGCITTVTATISPITNPTVTANPTQITCNGLNNGRVQLVGNGGSGDYEYNFNNLGWSTTSLYSNLSPGVDYTYLVRDSKGCSSASATIRLTEPTVVSGTITATIIKCSTTGTTPAVVTVTGAGGTGAYTYSFNGTTNFTTTNTFPTSTAGIVTAYIKDANNCQIGPLSVTIGALEQITDITIVDSGYDCSTVPAGGRVTLTAVKSGSLANVTYQIISGPAGFNPATNTTGNFTSLAPGNYVFQATDTATGCLFTKGHTIKATSDIVTGGSVLTSIKCFGGTGTIEFTVNGVKASGYDYIIRNAANTTIQQATGVSAATTTVAVPTAQPAGAYTITATDRLTKCQSTYTVTLTQPTAVVDVTATATTVNCNKFTAEITASATGGTPAYSYAVGQGAVVPTVFASNNVLTVDTANGTQLNWVVYVKDANGCTDNFPIAISVDAKPIITSVVVDNQCQTGSTSSFTITATATGLIPLSYSIDGINFQTSNTFTVSAGSHTVTVKDKNGCTTSATTPVVVYPKVGALAGVTKELDCTGTPNATIKVDITGGRTPYTYTVTKGAGTPSGVVAVAGASFTIPVTAANADLYTFAITDANGCTTSTFTTVAPIAPPTVTAVKVDASCNGSATGTVQLTGAGGSGSYTYSDDNITFGTISLFENLAAGDYTFYVKDSKGCTGSVNVTIGQPTTLTATATATTFTCSPTNTKQSATVTIAVPTTGTAPYQYSFNGSAYSNNNTLTVNDNGADQVINYSVKDAKGCTTAIQQITIKKLDPPVIATISGSPILCFPAASTTSTVTVNTTNGVGTKVYTITAPASATSNVTGASTGIFTGLAAGTYTFKVTDENGCFAIQSYTVNPLTPIVVTESKLSNVLCNAGNTGSARFAVTGFSATGNYAITVTSVPAGLPYTTATVGDVITLNGLVAGTYTFAVEDNTTKCTASKSVTITEPTTALGATLTIVNANCNVATSKVTVNATGGTPTYTYAFVQDNVTPVAADYKAINTANLNPAIPNWDVWVKDANGCVIKLDAALATDTAPDVTATVTNQCTSTGTSFTIKAVGTGGVGTLTYSISSGVAPSPADTFTVTSPGTYIITVKDANNCTDTVTVTVNAVLTASAVLVKDITCASPVDATITITAGGGLAPYTYLVSTDGVTFTTSAGLTGNTFTTNTAGDYYFKVTDASGCEKITNKVTVSAPQTVLASATKFDPTCNGYTDGSITLTGTAGVSPFTYSIDNGVTFVSTNVFGGLASGTYNYVIKDAKGCTSVAVPIILINPAPIAVNIVRNAILCNLNTPGSFDINVVSGGTAPYVYKLYDNTFTQIATYTETSATNPTPVYKFAGLNFGDYYITVVDSKGCEFTSGKLRIETPPYLQMSAIVDSNNCATGVNVTVTTSGGTPNYRYSIFGQPLTETAPTASASYTFIGLAHGTTYYLQVKDNNDCISILEFKTPNPPSNIKVTGTVVTDATCNGTSTGTLAFTVRDYDPAVTSIDYVVLNALTLLPVTPAIGGTLTGSLGGPVSGNITTLKAGSYVLKVSEVGGTLCSNAFTFDVSQPAQPLKTTISNVVNATCNAGAQVTLTTTGGTGPYTYAAGAAGFTPTAFGNSNVLTLDYALRQNWDIVVRDAKGCEDRVNITIALDPSPVIALSVVNKCVAEGAYGVRVSLTTAGIAPYSISVNGSSTYTPITIATGVPYDVTNLNSGSNTISIKDANGCIDTKSITIDKPLGVTPAATTLPTCANNDGVITLTPIGGSGPYTYAITPAVGTVTSNVISGVPAGTYTITITDTNTLCTATASVELSAPTPVDFNAVVTDASCNGASDGTITVNLAAGSDNPIYTYSILPAPVGYVQTNNVFSNLPQGTYSITVFSGRGCSLSKSYTVNQPLILAATASVAAYSCNASNVAQPAVVTVNVTAGTGTAPYKYNFDGSANYFDANTLTVVDNGAAQTIHYYVKDAKGCTFDNTVIVNPYQKITDLTFAGAAITCNAPATSITVTVVGGYAITKYEIVSPTASVVDNGTVNVFNGLTPDTYVFKVTDANGCSFQKSLTIKPVTNITVSGQLIKDVSCNETAAVPNGSVEFTVGNFAGTYTYSINGVAVAGTHTNPKVTLTNLAVGNYQIDVVDVATGCVASKDIDVSEPATPLIVTLVSNINANCNFGAKVSVVASGGTPGYTYAYAESPTAPLATAYKASPSAVLDPSKVWIAYAKDANGCIAQLPITIVTDPRPTIDPITGVCYDGSPVNVTLVGHGVAPLTYSIGNGFKTDPNFVLNAPGSYTFYVRDANGCDATIPYDYQLDQKLLLDAVLQDLTCAAPNLATVTLTATQGSTSYTGYEVSFNNGVYSPTTSPYTTNVPGTYTFRVTDSKGCQTVSKPVVVNPIVMPTIATSQFNVSCAGGNNGSITITAGAGLAPYEYSIDGTNYQTSNIFAALAQGTYTVYVRDAKKCEVSTGVTIIEPVVLTADVAVTPFGCSITNAPQDATVTLTPHNGTSGYKYSFDNGVTFGDSPTLTVSNIVTPKTINYVVIDANGCRATGSAIVNPYTPPTDMDITATPIYCNTAGGVATATVNTVTGGVTPYTYEIVSPTGTPSNTTGIFPGLLPNTYQIKVTDANGCSTTKAIIIKESDKINAEPQLLTDVLCNGGNTGTASFIVSNYTTPSDYTYSISPVTGTATQTGDVITYTGLTAGTYTFTVLDNRSQCTDQVVDFVINQPAVVDFTSTATNINCKKKTAEITITAAGGTIPYGYAVVAHLAAAPTTFGTNNVITVDTANGTILNWDVYVQDRNGCPVMKSQAILEDALPTTPSVAPYSQCPDATNGTYTFTITGVTGIAPIEYSIGSGFQSSPTFTVPNSGSYDVTVRDGNGCEVTTTAVINISPALKLDVVVNTLPDCNSANGTVTATASGGGTPANYSYSLDGNFGQTSGSFINLGDGHHTITVTDLSVTPACEKTVEFDIIKATPIEGFSVKATDVTCNTFKDGTITATIDETGKNDNPIYYYSITAGPELRPNQTSNIFTGLPKGQYTVTVTSGRGCKDLEDVEIFEPAPIVVADVTYGQFGCTTGNTNVNPTITVNTVTGGSGNYVIYQFMKNGVEVQRGASNTYTVFDLTGGIYTVNVFDDNSCSGSSTGIIDIKPFISLDDITINVDKEITCKNNEDITVTVATTGGTPAANQLLYSIAGIGGSTYTGNNTTGIFTGLPIGNYLITVENSVTGCIIEEPHYVSDPNTFELKANLTVSEVCFGQTNGSVELTFVDNQLVPQDDAGAFSYTITGGALPITGNSPNAGPWPITGLSAGVYTVVAILDNKPECEQTTTFTIAQPGTALTVTATKDDITCVIGNNDGVIYASANGGWDTDYQYELVNDDTKAVVAIYSPEFRFPNLTAGHYIVNVKDGKGCPASVAIELRNPDPIQFTAVPDANVLACYGDKNGVIRVSPPTGGQGSNYLYTLTVVSNNPVTTVGPQTDPVFTGLGEGRYTVTVTDGFSCSATTTAEIVITQPTLVTPILVKSRSQTCLTQSELTLSATGGTGTYQYSATEDFAIVLGTFTTSISFDVPVGTYSYFVRDANGCKSFVTAPIEIEPLEPLTITVDVSAAVVKCQGDASATIFAEATGGLGDYVYTLLDNNNNVVRAGQSNGTFANLPIGNYKVSVVSHDCSNASTVISIIEPPAPLTATPIKTDVTCFGANNGRIEIKAEGGTGTIQYAISPDLDKFDSKFIFDKLAPGDYRIVVKDDNGCSEIIDVIIENGALLYATLDETSIKPELCADDKNAEFRVDIFGGKAPYFVRIDDETAFVPVNGIGGAYHTFSELRGGDHKVYVTDSYGCGPMELNVSTPKPVTINPTTETTYGCETNTTIVSFDSSVNLADLDFSVDGGPIQVADNIFKDLAPGSHVINVRHSNGCPQSTLPFLIEGFDKLIITDITKSSKAEVNIIRVQGVGGKKDYVYSFNKMPFDAANKAPFTSSNEIRIYETAVYRVFVRDQNGCEDYLDIEGKFIDFCMPNYFTPNGDGRYDEIGPDCGALAYKDLTFDIFDRYGRVVAKYRVGQKWDGKYNGAELPTGDYWYVLKLNDEKDDREFVGHFTLYR